MKHNPQAITSAMQLYFSGESLRNTMKSLRLLGVEVSHKTVFMWIKKYVGLMQTYVEKIIPNVSDTWRADELYVKIKGDMKYLFALMDDETRFWIAQEVAESKYKHDARKLFQLGVKATEKKPMIQRIACGDEVDEEILELLREAGGVGLLPKDLAARLSAYKVRRHQVSRRILRMNRKLEKEIGERLVEKRGWHWALTGFGNEVWDETEKQGEEGPDTWQ